MLTLPGETDFKSVHDQLVQEVTTANQVQPELEKQSIKKPKISLQKILIIVFIAFTCTAGIILTMSMTSHQISKSKVEESNAKIITHAGSSSKTNENKQSGQSKPSSYIPKLKNPISQPAHKFPIGAKGEGGDDPQDQKNPQDILKNDKIKGSIRGTTSDSQDSQNLDQNQNSDSQDDDTYLLQVPFTYQNRPQNPNVGSRKI